MNFFFLPHHSVCGILVPHQGTLQGTLGSLNTGPERKSQKEKIFTQSCDHSDNNTKKKKICLLANIAAFSLPSKDSGFVADFKPKN